MLLRHHADPFSVLPTSTICGAAPRLISARALNLGSVLEAMAHFFWWKTHLLQDIRNASRLQNKHTHTQQHDPPQACCMNFISN